jgi:hypothetical protein
LGSLIIACRRADPKGIGGGNPDLSQPQPKDCIILIVSLQRYDKILQLVIFK